MIHGHITCRRSKSHGFRYRNHDSSNGGGSFGVTGLAPVSCGSVVAGAEEVLFSEGLTDESMEDYLNTPKYSTQLACSNYKWSCSPHSRALIFATETQMYPMA
ncbi:hypothetical protein A2U01_0032289 [Trifolium medium]|uniref:Uncharacterized protein n=1 Tax=Trifolium medium TaxID=97028 RepID=A0A392PI77_9FABA|nr:hypothetical protein [Trifolium medium]